ncbi:MAG: hypothetical protein H6741_29285 [Alphaproteobacteria bacterium]|nr:hypothetical protein [Alphaproteobacteria bacterium]MCB9796814.1 hypothetical protein [Alphaproteobacteria bacterium]
MARLSLISYALIAACGRDAAVDSEASRGPELLLSTLYGDTWLRIQDGEELGVYDLEAHHPERCAGEDLVCLGYQARGREGWDGTEEVLFTFSAMDLSDGSDLEREDRLGTIVDVDAETLELRWQVDQLDFSGLPDGETTCTWDPSDPCQPDAALSDRDHQSCRLYQPHDLQVLSEDAEGLELLVSDSRNARFLRLGVRRGERCALVLEVVGIEHPDWGNANAPNSFTWWSDEAGEHLLWSSKESYEQDGGGAGRGRIHYWTRDAAGWQQRWQHPREGYVNSPHGLTRWSTSEGDRLLFAHSLGLGEDWNLGPGGTIAALEWDAQGARYLGEWTLPRGLSYPRDVLVLGEEAWIADSGCKGGVDCEEPMGLYRVALPSGLEPQEVDGAWTSANRSQVIGELELLSGPLRGDLRLIYSVELAP